MPAGNHRNHVLGNIRRLASFARENFYPPQVRGVSVLGERLDRMSGYRNSSMDSAHRSSGFGRFSSLNSGNISQSGAGRLTSSAGGMASPSARDSDTIKRWRRV